MIEVRAAANGGFIIGALLRKFFQVFIIQVMIKLDIKAGGFDPKKYKAELAVNSDFKKFDDTLRMVLDCPKDTANEIEKFLEELYQRGLIFYGLHRSPEAVMTCLVESATDNRHVHFIDGNDGGYALAAKSMKEQILKRKSSQSSVNAIL